VRIASALRAIALSVVILSLIQPVLRGAASPEQQAPYVFYGYAPPTVKLEFAGQGSFYNHVGSSPILDVIGIADGTAVEVRNVTSGGLVDSFTVNRMELHETILRNDTYFKVVSSKLVAVCLRSGGEVSTFYPSVDGTFIGKEFIFMALLGAQRIFFVEGGSVTVYDREGRVVAESQGSANSVKDVSLRGYDVYRAVSTGSVLIASIASSFFQYLPSLTGGFIGRHFYGGPFGDHGWVTSIYVVALEESEVSVYDLTKPGWLIALEGPIVRKRLAAGESWYNITVLGDTPMRIESTGNISVLAGQGGGEGGHPWSKTGWWMVPAFTTMRESLPLPEYLGDDIKVIGALANQEIGFYAPTEAIIFPTEDTSVMIDGGATTLRRDAPFTLTGGVHSVRADAAVIIQIMGVGLRAEFSSMGQYNPSMVLYRDYSSYASYLVPVQGLGQTYPPPPPIGGVGELIPYVAAGVAVPVAIVVLFIALRRRSRTP